MDVLALYSRHFEILLIIWMRVSGLFLLAPIFSSRNIPGLVKIGLSGIIALIALPLIPAIELPRSILEYSLLMITELLIGLTIALLIQVIFAAIHLAGQLIDMQMGFFIVNVVDPEHGTQVPLIGNFKFLLALVVFLSLDGHHLLIKAIVNSFIFLPVGINIVNQDLVALLIDAFKGMFVTALQISAPTVGVLFIVTIALGIIAKTVPQMNVFMVGIPVNIGIGFIMLFVSLPLYVYILASLFARNYFKIDQFFSYFATRVL
ncbi:MAG: flagellar type III secretion system protein FliR [Clostridia bacterium]|nr:flagellar type III secretion system protein FliR [Clostridia bacterium]